MHNRDYKINNGNLFLCIKEGSVTRELFSLAFNDEREMLLSFPTDPTQVITSYENGNWVRSRRCDHVSYHKDGKIHAVNKEVNRQKKTYKVNVKNKANVFDLGDTLVLPLSLHSFFLGTANDELKCLDKKNSVILLERINSEFPPIGEEGRKLEWQLDKPMNFSIILFALGKDLSPETLPCEHPISKLMDRRFEQPILYPWGNPNEHNDSKLWVIFSMKTVRFPHDDERVVLDKLSSPDPKVWHLMSFGIAPPWKEIEGMK